MVFPGPIFQEILFRGTKFDKTQKQQKKIQEKVINLTLFPILPSLPLPPLLPPPHQYTTTTTTTTTNPPNLGFIFFIFAKHRLHPAVITIYITILSFLTHLIFKKFVIIFALETLLTITRIYCQSITPCIVGHVVMNFFLVIVSVAWPLGNLWLFSY